MARRTSPKAAYAMPRLPRSVPSPRRSPISRLISQGLLVVLDGPPHLAQGRIGNAQVAQMLPLAAAVADLPADHQGLLVVLDGPPHLAQGRIRQAQKTKKRAFVVRGRQMVRAPASPASRSFIRSVQYPCRSR